VLANTFTLRSSSCIAAVKKEVLDNSSKIVSLSITFVVVSFNALTVAIADFQIQQLQIPRLVSTEMDDRVRVQFPMPDIYFGM